MPFSEKILNEFNAVALNEIEEVKLMNRIDRKYWFHVSELNKLLAASVAHYDILEINGKRILKYQTTYFDTAKNDMFLKHQNGFFSRYKIRQRTYFSTNDSFFEIKCKSNKKQTQKKRIPTSIRTNDFEENEKEFIGKYSPYHPDELINTAYNSFYRITLVHKQKSDRCTIDINPVFWNDNNRLELPNLAIFEIKRGSSFKLSPIIAILQKLKINNRGLSKYCTARSLLEPQLKQNTFKARLRFLRQQILN